MNPKAKITGNQKSAGGTAMLVKIAYRNIWRNKRRTAFCFTAVGIAVFFIAVYSGYIGGMIKGIRDIVQVFDLGHVRVISETYEAESEYMPVQYPVADGKDWKEMAESIKKIPGVRAVFPRINTMATLQESTIKHAVLWGLNIEDEMAANNFNLTNRDNGLIEGRYPAPGANECAIGHVFAEKSGLRIGDRIPLKTVSAQFSDRMWSPVITGIFNYDYIRFDEGFIIVDFERLQRLLVMGEGTQQLIVFADEDGQSGAIAARVQNILGEGNIVTEWRDNYWVAVMESITPIYTAMFLIFLMVASFLIINTVVMIIHERIKEIGMMGCLGMTRREIVTVFFFESLFLAAFGALAGVLVGGVITFLGAYYPIRLGDLYGNTFSEIPMSNAVFTEFSLIKLFQAWLMGVVIASLFTLIPSLRSAFVEPVEALRR
ncbi:MAG: FtsX-like permease family protein [Chitinispirillales bacterium]|jgi:putative ABC transport system permease protein|nr:FtsX-like permease family protein [Chitinispirillales bacterium]